MSAIVGAIGCSHGLSLDHAIEVNVSRSDGDGAIVRSSHVEPLRQGFDHANSLIRAWAPDVVIVLLSEHANNFFFDCLPTFAIGIAPEFPPTDEGSGPYNSLVLGGNEAFGWYLARRLISAGFDLAVCQEMEFDHSILSPWPHLMKGVSPVPRVVPIFVNTLREPFPDPWRCWQLGKAIEEAVLAHDGLLKTMLLATGGLSHHLQDREFGRTIAAWDRAFLELLGNDEVDPSLICALDSFDEGGAQAAELLTWIVMRGALSSAPELLRCYLQYQLLGFGLSAYGPLPSRAGG